MELFEAPAFTRHPSQYLDDEQYRALQNALVPGRLSWAR
jgi:hypothetical protein